MRGKPQYQTYLSAIEGTINIVLMFIFVRFGIVAAATAFLCRTLVIFPVVASIAFKLIGVRWKTLGGLVAPSFAAATIMAAVIIFAGRAVSNDSHLLRLVVLSFGGTLFYVTVLAILDRESFSMLYRLIFAGIFTRRVKFPPS
jgi:hypothetical protein